VDHGETTLFSKLSSWIAAAHFSVRHLRGHHTFEKRTLKTHMNISAENAQGFALLAVLAGIATTIFWMMVGWRAMRAHERIAEASEQALRRFRETTSEK
jgi:hypothetical protein